MNRFFSGVRSSPRGLAAVERIDADLDDGELTAPATDVPEETRVALEGAVASLVVDAYVDSEVRLQALAVARRLRGERYAGLLSELADQSELEGTPLLAEVQAEPDETATSLIPISNDSPST